MSASAMPCSRAARTAWTAPGKAGEAHNSRPKVDLDGFGDIMRCHKRFVARPARSPGYRPPPCFRRRSPASVRRRTSSFDPISTAPARTAAS